MYRMGSEKIKAILFWVFVITISILMNSCSARKAEKNRATEEVKTEMHEKSTSSNKEESNVKSEAQTTVDDKNQTVTEETSYKPVDPTKEASVTTPDGKKHGLNNAAVVVKKTTQQNDTKTDKTEKKEEANKKEKTDAKDLNQKSDAGKTTEDIKVDRDKWSVWNFAWLLLLLPIYWLWKNKGIIKRPW